MDKYTIQYMQYIHTLCDVECVMLESDGGAEQEYCSGCPNKSNCTETHQYGMFEAKKWGGRYIYYCSRGRVFIALSLKKGRGILIGPIIMGSPEDLGVLSGPMQMGSPEDMEYHDSFSAVKIPIISTRKVNAIAELATAVFRNMIDTTNKSAQNDDLDYPLKYGEVKHVDTIYKITEYIKDNYNRKLTLDDISKHVFLSKSYLSKIFKEEMHCNLTTYINHIRVEKSKSLLLETSLSMIEISNMIGFDDQSYFTKIFKATEGISPKNYREYHKKRDY